VRWLARAIFQGCCVGAAPHRIAFGSATIGRRHIDDLCTSVQITEDHCSSLARRSAPLRCRSRAHCAPPFHRERLVPYEQCLPWAAAIRAICPQFLKDPHCAIADRDRNPGRGRARDNGKRLGNRMCNMHSRGRKHGLPACREFFGRAARAVGSARDGAKTRIHLPVTSACYRVAIN